MHNFASIAELLNQDRPGYTLPQRLYTSEEAFAFDTEVMLKSVASVELTADGRIRVLTASTEMGQGTKTVFPQMTNWLPDEEAAQLRSAFMEEICRLEAAPAGNAAALQRRKRAAAG